MVNITLTVDKAAVYEEVAKTTSYIGQKMDDDATAYDRIFTTDENQEVLERFWVEACNAATEQFKPFIITVSRNTEDGKEDTFTVEMEMSSKYDINLTSGINTSLFSYFVSYIVARWNQFTNKKEVDTYVGDAASIMDDIMRKIYWRKKPVRVAPA